MNDEDNPASMPPQPKTKEIPAASPEMVAIAQLANSVESGFREQRADSQLMRNELTNMKERVGSIESWKLDQEARATRTSTGVRNLSATDAEHDAQLAQERAAREALAVEVAGIKEETAVQTEMLRNIGSTLSSLVKNPIVSKLAYAVVAAIIAWLAKGHI